MYTKPNNKDLRFDPVLRAKMLTWIKDNPQVAQTGGTITEVNSNDILIELQTIAAAGGGGGATPTATHMSPSDFTATYTSDVTITLSGHDSITDKSQIKYIYYVPTGATVGAYLIAGEGGVYFTYAANVITVGGASTPFASGDVYEVGINYQKKAYASEDIIKIIEQAGLETQYTDPETLVTGEDIGVSDNIWIDQGGENECKGYKTAVVWIDFTANNSTGNEIQILVKHTNGGTVEYVLEISDDYQKTLGDNDIAIAYPFPMKGVAYFQVQSRAAIVGATEGTFDIVITKEW